MAHMSRREYRMKKDTAIIMQMWQKHNMLKLEQMIVENLDK